MSTLLFLPSLATCTCTCMYMYLQDHMDDLLRQLIGILASNDITAVTCTVGVLCNLTCNNAKNKTILCQLHGVQVYLHVHVCIYYIHVHVCMYMYMHVFFCQLHGVQVYLGTCTYTCIYMHVLMRDEKEGRRRSKQGQTNNKAKYAHVHVTS